MGLVYNIGVLPIFTQAEHHPECFTNPVFLDRAIEKLDEDDANERLKLFEELADSLAS